MIRKENMNVENLFICYQDLSVEEVTRKEALSEKFRELEVIKIWHEDGLCLKIK